MNPPRHRRWRCTRGGWRRRRAGARRPRRRSSRPMPQTTPPSSPPSHQTSHRSQKLCGATRRAWRASRRSCYPATPPPFAPQDLTCPPHRQTRWLDHCPSRGPTWGCSSPQPPPRRRRPPWRQPAPSPRQPSSGGWQPPWRCGTPSSRSWAARRGCARRWGRRRRRTAAARRHQTRASCPRGRCPPAAGWGCPATCMCPTTCAAGGIDKTYSVMHFLNSSLGSQFISSGVTQLDNAPIKVA